MPTLMTKETYPCCKLLVNLALISVLGGCATADTRTDTVNELTQRYDGNVPGASLLVILTVILLSNRNDPEPYKTVLKISHPCLDH